MIYLFIVLATIVFVLFYFSYFLLSKKHFLSQQEFRLLKITMHSIVLLPKKWSKTNLSYIVYQKCSFCKGSGVLVKKCQNQTSLQTTFEIETSGCRHCGGKAFFHKKICIGKSTFLESTSNNQYFKKGKGYIHNHYIWSAQEKMFLSNGQKM